MKTKGPASLCRMASIHSRWFSESLLVPHRHSAKNDRSKSGLIIPYSNWSWEVNGLSAEEMLFYGFNKHHRVHSHLTWCSVVTLNRHLWKHYVSLSFGLLSTCKWCFKSLKIKHLKKIGKLSEKLLLKILCVICSNNHPHVVQSLYGSFFCETQNPHSSKYTVFFCFLQKISLSLSRLRQQFIPVEISLSFAESLGF